MLKVVFTGPAVDRNGKSVVRADLVEACIKLGIIVQTRVGADTNLLVASRTDTVKARAAVSIPTVDYPTFITWIFGGSIDATGRDADPFVDSKPVSKKPLDLKVDRGQLSMEL